MSEGNEKDDLGQPKKSVVSITVPNVPDRVNKSIKKYRKRINFERNKEYSQMDAYREFLIEKTKTL